MATFEAYYDEVNPAVHSFLSFAEKENTPFTREITDLFAAHFTAVGTAIMEGTFPKEILLKLHGCIDTFMFLESDAFNYAALLKDTVYCMLWHERKSFNEKYLNKIIEPRLEDFYRNHYGEPNGVNKKWASNWFVILDKIATFVRNQKYEI